jgi:hypothetical protein
MCKQWTVADALQFACFCTEFEERPPKPSLSVALQMCEVRRWLWSVALAAAAGATLLRHVHGLLCTARLFCIIVRARLSTTWVLSFFLLTDVVVVVVAAPQAHPSRCPKVSRVQGRVRDPEAHSKCAEGKHIALGGGGRILTLRERR